jgi:hypothetical protein
MRAATKSPGLDRGFSLLPLSVALQAIAWTVWETRATGADVDAAGAVTAGVDVPRVSRWTKWYGGQGPDICIWQSRSVALVLANLF